MLLRINMGLAYISLEEYEKVLQSFDEALKIQPANKGKNRNLCGKKKLSQKVSCYFSNSGKFNNKLNFIINSVAEFNLNRDKLIPYKPIQNKFDFFEKVFFNLPSP